ncbi:NAD-dependent deacylase [Deinococcus sonorensis KR-87]|uniref:NAD-dependent protein deacylase n=1 Tax=Deinococcus sonorensis KR-87 TaxID=694439 RepID=A0AAU7UFC9_9DEIO
MSVAEAAARLRQARRVAVLTGAGISAESGIPTFRDAQSGLWARFRPEDLASPEAYHRDPELVWQWYAGRYRDVMAAEPNAGHRLLVQLERQVGEGFSLITQNVDGLHARAGSRDPVELHGTLLSSRCERCGHVQPLPPPDQFTPPPVCERCGARGRPNVVWFGEYLPPDALSAAEDAFDRAEVALVIGTSAQVYPAAGLAAETLRAGGVVIEINPEPTDLSMQVQLSLRDTASVGLRRLLEPDEA